MPTMGRYCKAYPISMLREFAGWTETEQNARREKRLMEGQEIEVTRELTDDAYLYLQEDYTVTDGIFNDENTIFDKVTPEWVEYCSNILKFEVPLQSSAAAIASEGAESKESAS